MPIEILVGLGSNVDPHRHLSDAIEALRSRYGGIDVSPVYRNPAVGFAGDDFLNLVVRFACDQSPQQLERAFLAMERVAGRQSPGSAAILESGSRTLDVDLLLHGSSVDPQRGLPRIDILRYAFVLRPLAELAPPLVHPLTGRTMASHWRDIAAQSPPMRRIRLSATSTSRRSVPRPRPESAR